MVFYFTATGNSLYAAKKFSPEPVSIPQVMRGGERHLSDDSIGIVFPDYSAEPPKVDALRQSGGQAVHRGTPGQQLSPPGAHRGRGA